jgi:hypothetical protein
MNDKQRDLSAAMRVSSDEEEGVDLSLGQNMSGRDNTNRLTM